MSYQELEEKRRAILKKYCCRLHIIDPNDADEICRIEETQRLLRIKQPFFSEVVKGEKK